MTEFLLIILIVVCGIMPFVFNRVNVYFKNGSTIIISKKLSKHAMEKIEAIIAEDLTRSSYPEHTSPDTQERGAANS